MNHSMAFYFYFRKLHYEICNGSVVVMDRTYAPLLFNAKHGTLTNFTRHVFQTHYFFQL
jgi:hypothetical protein